MAIANIGVTLQIAGQINSSLGRSFNFATQGLRRLQTQATATTVALSRIGRGFLGLAALGGGFAAFAGINAFMSNAVRLGKEQENTTLSLQNLLINNLKLRHQNVLLAGQELKAIEAQAQALQEQTGIYSQVLIKGAAMQATAHLTAKQIMQMQGPMANLLAYRRTMGDSPEQLQKAYEAISKAIYSGQARGLNQEGLQISNFERRMMPKYALMGDYQKNIDIILRALKIFRGEGEKYRKSVLGQVDIATDHIKKRMALIGEAFIPIQQQVTLLADKFVSLITPSVIVGLHYVTRWMTQLNEIMKEQMPTMRHLVREGWAALASSIEWFKKNAVWLIPTLTALVKLFVAWKVAMNLYNVLKPVVTIVSTLVSGAASLALALGPIGLTAGALAFAGAAVAIVMNWDKVRKLFSKGMEGLIGKQAMGDFGEWMYGTKAWTQDHKRTEHPEIRPYNRKDEPGMLPMASRMAGAGLAMLVAQVPNIKKAVYVIGNLFVIGMSAAMETAYKGVVWVWDRIVDVAKAAWGATASLMSTIWKQTTRDIKHVWQSTIKAMGDNWNYNWNQSFIFFTGLWKGVTNGIKSIWATVTSWLWANFLWNWNLSVQQFKQTWSDMKKPIVGVWDEIIKSMGEAWNVVAGTTGSWWNSAIKGIQDVSKAIQNFLIQPVQFLNDQWQKFLDLIHGGGGGGDGGKVGGAGTSGSWTGGNQPSGINWAPNGLPGIPFQPDTSGAKTLNAIWNNPGALGPTKSALRFGATPSGKFDTGHPFMKFPTREAGAAAQFSMWMNKDLYVGHTLAQAIKNWVGPGEKGEAEAMSKWTGVPLNAIITDAFLRSPQGIRLLQAQARYEGANVLTPEQWKRGQDWAYKGIKPDQPAPASKPLPDSSGITIHNNVTYHIHGGDHHQIATLHHEHIEKMKTDLADAMDKRRRSSFVNSSYV